MRNPRRSLTTQSILYASLALASFCSNATQANIIFPTTATVISESSWRTFPTPIYAYEFEGPKTTTQRIANLPDFRLSSGDELVSIEVDFNARVGTRVSGFISGITRSTSSRSVQVTETYAPVCSFLGCVTPTSTSTVYEHSASLEASARLRYDYRLLANTDSFLGQLFGGLNYTSGFSRPTVLASGVRLDTAELEASAVRISDRADPALIDIAVQGEAEWSNFSDLNFSRTYSKEQISYAFTPSELEAALRPGVLSGVQLEHYLHLQRSEGPIILPLASANIVDWSLDITFNTRRDPNLGVCVGYTGQQCVDVDGCVRDYVDGRFSPCYAGFNPAPVAPTSSAVPAPGSVSLLALGLIGLGAARRREREVVRS